MGRKYLREPMKIEDTKIGREKEKERKCKGKETKTEWDTHDTKIRHFPSLDTGAETERRNHFL